MEGLPKQKENFEKRKDPKKMFNSYLRVLKLTMENLKFPLLDVGANTGGFVTYCRENLGHLDCFGVEPSDYRRGDTGGVVKGSAQEIPFPDESFEMVVSKNVLPIFKDEFEKAKSALEEMLRVLKKGGELAFDFMTIEQVQRFFEEGIEGGFSEKEINLFQKEDMLKRNIEGITQFNEYLDLLRERVQSIEIDDAIIKIIK